MKTILPTSSPCGTVEVNPTDIHEDTGSIPSLPQWVKGGGALSCGLGHRCSSDPLWLWYRPVATTPVGPLAWKFPHAMGVTQKTNKQKENRNKHPPPKKTLPYISNFTCLKY